MAAGSPSASPGWLAFSVIMLVVFGTWNTMVSKSVSGLTAPGMYNESLKVCETQYRGKVSVVDLKEKMKCSGTISIKSPTPEPLNNPLWQVLFMFLGMTSNLILHICASNPEDPPILTAKAMYYIVPSAFSLLASALMMASLQYIPASTYEMFRGSTLVWTAFISYILGTFPKNTSWVKLLGIPLIFMGLTLTGISSVSSSGASSAGTTPPPKTCLSNTCAPAKSLADFLDSKDALLGCGLVLAGSLCKALMVVSEAAFVTKSDAAPLAVVGLQGVWGTILTAGLLVALHLTPGSHYGSVLSITQGAAQVASSNELFACLAATGAGMAAYNYFGAVVSKGLSGPHRVVADSLRTLTVWAAALLAGSESLDSAGPEKLCGLALLVAGALVYNVGWPAPAAPALAAQAPGQQRVSVRQRALNFLNGKTEAGLAYELLSVALILANVVCFVWSTVEGLDPWTYRAFDLLEEVSTTWFLLEYAARLWCSADDEECERQDRAGRKDELSTRLCWVLSFYSMVDLFSIAPFYLERASLWFTSTTCGAKVAYVVDLPEFQFLKILRLFRILRVEGRLLDAFSVFDDIYAANRKLIFTSGFVGGSVWVVLSAAMWAAERENPAMEGRYATILSSSFFTLCNMFGEFPLMDERTPAGKAIAVFTAVVAAVMFGIPTGIFGNGFQAHAEKKKKELQASESPADVADRRQDAAFQRVVLGCAVVSAGAFIVESVAAVRQDAGAMFLLKLTEQAAIVIFMLDYWRDFACARRSPRYAGLEGAVRYTFSLLPLLDLLQIAASLVLIGSGQLVPAWAYPTLRNLRLLRMLKIPGFRQAFSVFDDILAAYRDVLTVTGFAALVFWVVFSSVMYTLERGNPAMVGPDGSHYYRSIPAAMWITLLNLSGEVPLCDYTPAGKVVCGLMGLVAVGTFAIPIGVLGTGFQEWVDDRCKEPEEAEGAGAGDAAGGGTAAGDQAGAGWTWRLFEFVEGRTYWGGWLELALFYLVFASVAQQALETLPAVYTAYRPLLDAAEALIVACFALEYLLRLVTAHHRPGGGSALGYVLSGWSLIDLATLLPYAWSLAFPGGAVDQWDEVLRTLRLLRLLKMEKYVPSLTLVDDVLRNNARKLALAGWVTGVSWLAFAAMLWTSESAHAVETGDNGVRQADRFADLPSSLPYTMVLLSGDYPLVDFTASGRLACFLMCVFAVGLVSVPSGIIASGFQEEALKERERRRGLVSSSRPEADAADAVTAEPEYLNDGSLAARVHSLLSPEDENGVWLDRGLAMLIVANVAAVVAESDPACRAALPAWLFPGLEAISAVVFTVEYALRIYSAPYDRRAGYSRRGYLQSFFGTADLLALLPFYLEVVFEHYGVACDPAWLSVLRLLRILQLEHFTEAFTLLDDVFRASRDTLVATSLLAVIIWVFSSYAFFLLERGNPKVGDAFQNLPNAMYYTAIFLSGEWGHVDFTPAGKVLCCLLVVVGLGLYALPVGAFFDAFGEVLSESGQAEAGDDEAAKNSTGAAAGPAQAPSGAKP